MNHAEQKARDLLGRLGVDNAQSFTAGDLVELANLIASNRQARRLLTAAADKIPDYVDGRNDKLCDAITSWLESTHEPR